MKIQHNNHKIRYTGRWNIQADNATSTANGNYFEFSYLGECAVLEFDISRGTEPLPHLYIQVDGGAKIEVSCDKFIRISAENGQHSIRVILKGSVETQSRWFAPIQSGVSLVGIEAEEFLSLPEDNRKTIEYIGDSITEGISIDTDYTHFGDNRDMVYWDDSTAGYAWLTAEALDLRPIIMGYGAVGTTRTGAGEVPRVGEAYPFYSDGFPMESANADLIVINHGTNDRSAEKDLFKKRYFELLQLVRSRNPKSKIIALVPFSGCFAAEIDAVVKEYNVQSGDDVFYIDSTGWVPPEPIHPTRKSHKIISKNLAEILKEFI